jgi:uncharacterized protein (UPF0147 family)
MAFESDVTAATVLDIFKAKTNDANIPLSPVHIDRNHIYH